MVEHAEIAAALASARRHRHTVTPPSQQTAFGIDDAYVVQAALHAQALADGWEPRGFKIGLTNRTAWPRLGVESPFWAPMYGQGIRSDTTLVHADFVSPRVEAEVVLHFRTPVEPGASTAALAQTVDWCALAFEIVDSHYPDWTATPADLVADYGCHAGLSLGQPAAIDPGQLQGLQIGLYRDGELVASGSGSQVLDGPLDAVAAVLSLRDAPTVQTDDLVSTGALTGGAHPVQPGERWELRPGGDLSPLLLDVVATRADRSSE